ncbi:LOW QUALITY PROTEIN: ankyrin repeat and protein kinase domain-containing protein 1 [Siniperca chuatsi]|uniref:LOW QUALITY PROTEIN: ankyrin repeat and protein kinase domain-containing protein 1 n=1 Tax=Siniperca chuatsi TaxID=119488 RepID=UPI001CE1BF1A|nr:LOW QUALITY PROTEIN: ankyrin repeat and protein kinase domain-containing protein 1 [Siniperca chuatsi]
MDCLDGSPEQFRNFKKDDFEADWIKVAECRFGQVYQVKLKDWRVKCALKSSDTTLCANNFYRRTIDEASNIAKVKFKYIVSVYGLCSEATSVVMEYMSNGSLNNLLASHNLMWPKKFHMIHEASMGMNFLHSMKPPLLHLNLKTSNILLDDHLHVKISDFGLIHWEEGMSKKLFMEHLTARGNISYIPPETFTQCTDPPGTSFDVYSFGIVIWEILTQQKPYAGCSVTTVLLQVSHGKRPCVELIPEQKPHECDQIISIMRQCWDQDHRNRPQFSDTVRKTEALSEVLKIPGPIQCPKNGDEGQKLNYPWLVSPIHKIAVPEMPDLTSDDQHDKDSILSLLSKKDFGSFRQSVKREHVYTEFSGKKSLLHYTVASRDAASVERVLSLGAEVNCTTARGYTPLIIAVLHSLHDIISLLLEHGAAATQGDEDQWTALHFAAQNGDDRTARLLLDKGAVADAAEKAGWMPLHLACQNGHETVVRLLLSRLSEEAVREREALGRTPLHLASAYGHLNIAKLLLSQGADPNATDCSLSTALHLSAEEGHNRVVRLLLKSGAIIDSADRRGYTPLHLAALKGHTGICRQLLSSRASPDCRTLQGWTPMHLAALRGHEATVVQLESQGGCVNARGDNGWTPLHLACHQSEPEVVAKLLAAKADPNVSEDSEGWTPLHVACTSVSFPSVLHLISHHADVNAINSGKATPLHLAAQHGCMPIVKALLLNGAERTLLDSSGSTALNVARRCEKWEIVQLLEE